MKFLRLFPYLLAAGLLYAADIEQIIRPAQNGDPAALLELANNGSPEARSALEGFVPLPSNSPYSRELRKARAKTGIGNSLLDLTCEALYGDSGTSLNALQDLQYVGGTVSQHVITLLLDDFTGAQGGGDLQYFSNTQNALFLLPKFMPDGPTSPEPLNENMVLKGRRQWHDWIAQNADRLTIPPHEIDAIASQARKRSRLCDAAVASVLITRPAYDVRVGGAGEEERGLGMLKETLEIAYGERPGGIDLPKRFTRLSDVSQRTILKALAFLKRPNGISIICQVRASYRGRTDGGAKRMLEYISGLLGGIGIVDSRVVPVFSPSGNDGSAICNAPMARSCGGVK